MPGSHAAPLHEQTPPLHWALYGQGWSQLPQWLGSFCVSTQTSKGGPIVTLHHVPEHEHLPMEQVVAAVSSRPLQLVAASESSTSPLQSSSLELHTSSERMHEHPIRAVGVEASVEHVHPAGQSLSVLHGAEQARGVWGPPPSPRLMVAQTPPGQSLSSLHSVPKTRGALPSDEAASTSGVAWTCAESSVTSLSGRRSSRKEPSDACVQAYAVTVVTPRTRRRCRRPLRADLPDRRSIARS